jgi:SAM-dependent methyltransferase
MTAMRGLGARLVETWRYRRYLAAQRRQSRAKRAKDASFRLEPFVSLVARQCGDLGADARVLCIGARNEVELEIFARHGFRHVTAIDLWSASPRILVGDMHRMVFADAAFDLVFASHVFEHAWDFSRVAAECLRVLRPGGYVFCAVPIGFEPTEHDRYDFKDAAGILRYFAAAPVTVLAEERMRPGELSVLFRVGAPRGAAVGGRRGDA